VNDPSHRRNLQCAVTVLSASDKRALRACGQRGGAPLTPERAMRFVEAELVRLREDLLPCSQGCPRCPPRYSLKVKGINLVNSWLATRGRP
jgi:hypothetical protein